MPKFYTVTLTELERAELKGIIKKGKHGSQTYRNAYILLNVDEGGFSEKVTNEIISKVLQVGTRTIDRVKKKFVTEGFEACLSRKKSTREYEKKVDGDVEAHLVSIACSEPPKGYAKWSLRMLADKAVELKYVESISHETVRCVLKKRVKTLEGKGLGDSSQ